MSEPPLRVGNLNVSCMFLTSQDSRITTIVTCTHIGVLVKVSAHRATHKVDGTVEVSEKKHLSQDCGNFLGSILGQNLLKRVQK